MALCGRTRLRSVLAAALCLSAGGCDPSNGPADAIFQDTRSPTKYGGSSVLVIQFAEPETVPRYLVRNGRLFLLTQVTQPHMLDVRVVDMPRWAAVDLAAFRRSHPELAPLLSTGGWLSPR